MHGTELLEAARKIAPEIIGDRREIHRQPELAYTEQRTSALVAERLHGLGIEVKTGVADTGVIGLIEGGKPGKTVLLRADMDALPIQEVSSAEFCSQTTGIMHACGHDAHTAMLLGTARLLVDRRAELRGNVKLMFQPAEEIGMLSGPAEPGMSERDRRVRDGGFGALRMIEAGILESPRVDAAFGQHTDAVRYVGEIVCTPGAFSAASDRFTIKIIGKGGHAARPNLAVDPIVIAAQVITALQTLVSREIGAGDQAVVTVGALEAGTAANVISDHAVLRGTVRTLSEPVRNLIEKRIATLSTGIARAMNGDADVNYVHGYPSIMNDPEAARLVEKTATEVLGPGAAVGGEAMMGGEDFSYLVQKVPGAYYRLGVRNRAWQEPRPNHSALFEIDEEALPIGAAVLAATAITYLSS